MSVIREQKGQTKLQHQIRWGGIEIKKTAYNTTDTILATNTITKKVYDLTLILTKL